MDAEDVVVSREHVHGDRVVGGTRGDNLDLRVIDAREVAGTGGLMLLGLEREGVRVDTGVGAASVVVVGLHLVEVLTRLFLEAVLTVKDELEGVEGTNGFFGEHRRGANRTNLNHGGTNMGSADETVGTFEGALVGVELDVEVSRRGGEVPHTVVGLGVGEAPHQFLDGVVVRQADLLGTTVSGDGIGTGVLDLLDQVFMTLLGEPATLFGVQVDVVGPHLEHTSVQVGGEVGRQVEIQTDFVVLERNQGQVQSRVPVEEEDQRQVDSLGVTRGGHLTPSGLLGLVQVKLRVHAPPLLVVLVDALATDGQFNVVDGTLGNPVAISGGGGGGSRLIGLQLDVHVTNEITVARNSDGHAAGVGGGTVHGLFDVLHREVSVALVFGLEEGHLRVTGKVDILGAVSYELHKTTGHFESCCTIHRENNSGQTRIF